MKVNPVARSAGIAWRRLSRVAHAMGVLLLYVLLGFAAPLALSWWLAFEISDKQAKGGLPFLPEALEARAELSMAELASVNGFASDLLAPIPCRDTPDRTNGGQYRCWNWQDKAADRGVGIVVFAHPLSGTVFARLELSSAADWLALRDASQARWHARHDPPARTGSAAP